jgi:Domain of unknown function (DUF4412)
MNRTLAVVATMICLAFTARGDFLIKERFEQSDQSEQITLKIKGSKVRLDTGEETSALIDSGTGVTTLMIHPNKSFLKIGPEEIKQQTKALKEMLGQKLENPADVQLKPTGKKEKINGFDTEEYTTTFNGVEMSLFIAKQYPNYQKIVEALYQVQNGPAMEAFRSISIPPDKYPGLPIRTTQTIVGQKIVMTLLSVQEMDLPEGDFAIPADYKELNPPTAEKSEGTKEKQ